MTDPTTITAAALAAVACQDLVGEATHSAWQGLTRVVQVLHDKFKDDEQGLRALSRVESQPADPGTVWGLIEALDPYVCHDPDFRHELNDLIGDLGRRSDIGKFVTQVSGAARIGKLVTIDMVHGDVSF